MIGIDQAALTVAGVLLVGRAYFVGDEISIHPLAGAASSVTVGGILLAVLYWQNQASKRSEKRWQDQNKAHDRDRSTMLEILKELTKNKPDSG